MSRKVLHAALLTVAAAAARAGRRRRRDGRSHGRPVQGRVDLRRPAQRRRLVAGARRRPPVRAEDARRQGRRRPTRRTSRTGRSSSRRWRASSQQGYKMIFGTSFGYFDKKLAAKYPDVLFEQATGTDTVEEPRRSTSAPARTRSTSPAWRRAPRRRTATSATSSPFAIPEVIRHANAFTLGAQATHPGAKVKLDLDERVVQPGRREEGGGEPRRRGRGRARPERRLAGDRPVRGVEGHPVGRLRLRRAEVRAEVVADRRRSTTGARTTSAA